MLRVTTLYAATAAATAAYYTRYLTEAEGEQPGQWVGEQSRLLGLQGEVTTEALQALLEGRDPNTGTPLGNPFIDRTAKSGKVVRAVAGFDATLSAPKSLSVWWALTRDDRLAACHDVAVRAVVDCIERYGSTTRVRSNGRRLHPDTQGLTAAVFRQTTSRLDDPQLHSHVVISSKVQTADGRWLALDARVLKGYQRALGGLYQSVLRAELTARFGVGFGEIVNGQAEIAGVPDELLAQFSKRTTQVDTAYQTMLAEFWAREGRDPTPKERGALGRQAAADTRGHKTGHGVPDLRSRWLTEAAAVGVTPASLTAGIRTAGLSQTTGRQQVSIGDVVAAVSDRRSAWHRLDVLQAICDTTRPQPGINSIRWAATLDRATDTVLEHCVDLDPNEQHTAHRDSDGRSVWIEPSARHHTSTDILAQEEHIISWAIDAQHTPPQPSTTINARGLDVMQADAAAAVAGRDRLVVVVGPAGAGKTTMLAAAVTDLDGHGRPVLGLAPTAKAARVLQTETGMEADTVAKLLHEHSRTDRPPNHPWNYPDAATVIIDEAGMLNTRDLHQLTQLADQHNWRLVLVGDPHQLQGVGRGGMFTELCATSRTIELDTIHRFRHEWEATASLKLRHGDPTALDAYLDHDRIIPGPLHEHLDNIADAWINTHQQGEHLAITTTTNEHVDAINHTIHQMRLELGQLGPEQLHLGHTTFCVGDVITTRRNERLLRTTTGDSVRNRDYWTIDSITENGELAVTRIDGHGHTILPADYVTEHVQLGYAATEPGNQSATATRSITLATPATTCRGLYVAVTRGREENLICVVTTSHDIVDAVDTLQHILATDRADLPATRTRRDLAESVPSAPQIRPRCSVPDWFHTLRHDTRSALDKARTAVEADQREDARIQERITELDQQLADLAPQCAPHDQAIARATHHLKTARHSHYQAVTDLATSSRLHRHAARQAVTATAADVTTSEVALTELTNRARPLLDRRSQLSVELHRLQQHLDIDRPLLHGLRDHEQRIAATKNRLAALDTWADWANGNTPSPAALMNAAHHLRHAGGELAHLAEPLTLWMQEHKPAAQRPTRNVHPQHTARPNSPGLDIGL
jgi:conjugative relaxase-like TrwC/TraI family protein